MELPEQDDEPTEPDAEEAEDWAAEVAARYAVRPTRAYSQGLVEMFFRRVRRQTAQDDDPMSQGCWQWMGSLNDQGHGIFRLGPGKVLLAHRTAWEIMVGPLEPGQTVVHDRARCNNRGCVRPEHLLSCSTEAAAAAFTTEPTSLLAGNDNYVASLFHVEHSQDAEPLLIARGHQALEDLSTALLEHIRELEARLERQLDSFRTLVTQIAVSAQQDASSHSQSQSKNGDLEDALHNFLADMWERVVGTHAHGREHLLAVHDRALLVSDHPDDAIATTEAWMVAFRDWAALAGVKATPLWFEAWHRTSGVGSDPP